MTAADVDPGRELVDWVREVTGAVELSVERRSGGGSRAGYAVSATAPDGAVRELWLRKDTGAGPQSDGPYTVRREAAVYQQLAGRGLRVAEVVAVHPSLDAFLMTRLYGSNQYAKLDAADQHSVATELMRQLAHLHAIDVRELDLPGVAEVGPLEDHLRAELDIWEAQYRRHDEPEPTIELALAWLRRSLPSGGRPVSLVQGDTGPGNFMFEGGQLTAITDWELAHLGDPLDDLAWIYVHDLQERIPDLAAHVAEYARFSGTTVELSRLRYFLVLAQTRCAIGTRNGLLARDSRGEIAGHLIYSTLHAHALADALAFAVGVPVEEAGALPDPGESPRSWMYDVVLEDLRQRIVPAIEDGFAARRAKGAARLVKVLREQERFDAAFERTEAADLAALVPGGPADADDARRRLCELIRADEVPVAAAVRYCVRHWARRVEIARPAMGVLADRRFAPLPATDLPPG